MIANILKLIIIIYATTPALAVSIGVPAPDVMLREANLVVTGSLHQTEAGWELTVSEPLKGALKHGDRVRMDTRSLFLRTDYFTKLVGSESFLFVGYFHEADRYVYPRFVGSSFWPQGVRKQDLPERSLEGVVAFARKSLSAAAPGTGTAASGAEAEVSQPNLAELELTGALRIADGAGSKAAGGGGAPVAFDFSWLWLLLVPVGLLLLWRWRGRRGAGGGW